MMFVSSLLRCNDTTKGEHINTYLQPILRFNHHLMIIINTCQTLNVNDHVTTHSVSLMMRSETLSAATLAGPIYLPELDIYISFEM